MISRAPKVLRETVLYVPASVLPLAAGIVSLLVYVRLFSTAEYGCYVLALATMTICAQVFGEWLSSSTLRLYPECRHNGAALSEFRTALLYCLGLAIAGSALCVGLLVASVSGWRYVVPVLCAASASIAARIPLSVLRVQGKTIDYALLSGLGPCAALGAGYTVLRLSGHAELVFAGMALASVTQLLVAQRRSELRLSVRDQGASAEGVRKAIRSITSFGLPMVLTSLGAQALIFADRFIVSFLLGDAAAGLYAGNYAIGEKAAGIAFAPIFGATYPLMVRSWTSQRWNESASHLRHAAAIYLAYIAPVAIASVFGAQYISARVLKPEYVAGASVIPLIFIATAIWNTGILMHQPLEMERRTLLISAAVISVAIVNTIASLLVTPIFGVVGAAWVRLLCYVGYAVFMFFVSTRVTGFRWIGSTRAPKLASAEMAAD